MKKKTLADLAQLVLKFREERDWKQFHNPKDMALSLVLEASEFLELTQWKNGKELDEFLSKNRQRAGENWQMFWAGSCFWLTILA